MADFAATGDASADIVVDEESLEDLCARLEARVQRDEGGRGIYEILLPPGELHGAAQTLYESRSVAIISGFPCMLDHEPPTETDGPLGAMAIARACLALGKAVSILTDECNEDVFLACCAASGLDDYQRAGLLSLASFPGSASFDVSDARRLKEACAAIDLVIAIERAGPAEDGCYYTMRGRDMTALVAPLDELLQPAGDDDESPLVTPPRSICIGDGGNEVGMGKIYNRLLASSIPNARQIACVVPADHLLVCSVSNWGGYALAAATAVYASQQRRVACRDLVLACVPKPEDEQRMCERIVAAGARDGISGRNECMVDGMPLEASLVVLRDLRDIAMGVT